VHFCRQTKWTPEKIKEFRDKATSGNYDNALCVCMDYFDVR
jgi:hypothetical protein